MEIQTALFTGRYRNACPRPGRNSQKKPAYCEKVASGTDRNDLFTDMIRSNKKRLINKDYNSPF